MQALGIAGLVCCVGILPVTLGWNPPLAYCPDREWEHNPRIHTKPSWPPHVPCRLSHSTLNTTTQNKSELTSTPIVDAFLLNRKQKKQLEKTIYDQKQLITYLQQQLILYESKEELRKFWITEFKEVRWAGLAQNELLVLSKVNATELRQKP